MVTEAPPPVALEGVVSVQAEALVRGVVTAVVSEGERQEI